MTIHIVRRARFGGAFTAVASVVALLAPSLAFAASANDFNPKISLILQGGFADYSASAEANVPGVALGPETELRPEGIALGESELVIEANIDHQFRGRATVAFEQEDGETVVAMEEAYIGTLGLPGGLSMKFGRFFSGIGYLNEVHSHAWDFADAPLAYRALLAGRVIDDGLQARWVAPLDIFLELGAEALQGAAYPGGGEPSGSVGAWSAFAHAGSDMGSGGAWRAGVSVLDSEATESRVGDEEDPLGYSGDSRVYLVDVVYKWAPQGNMTRQNLVLQAEYLKREQRGTVVVDPDGTPSATAYEGDQSGWYAQAAYQFVPRWRFGLRYDRLATDNRISVAGGNAAAVNLANQRDDSARRRTVMLDWSPSEFSRLRMQYARDASRPNGVQDNQFVVQFIHSLGAHAAHQF